MSDTEIVCPTCHMEMWPSELDHGYCPNCETDLTGVSDENRNNGGCK